MYLLLQSLKENLSIKSASYILVGLDGDLYTREVHIEQKQISYHILKVPNKRSTELISNPSILISVIPQKII